MKKILIKLTMLNILMIFLILPAHAVEQSDIHKIYEPSSAALAKIEDIKALDPSGFSTHNLVTKSGSIVYRLYSPKTKDRLPLIIVLHGSGQIGSDNVSQLGTLAKSWVTPAIIQNFSAHVVVPQVPSRSANYLKAEDGNLYSVPGASLESLENLIDDLSKNPSVDTGRIYLVGFSMGGSTALNLLARRPHVYAGLVAFAPVPPSTDYLKDLARVPILLVHGALDTENPYGFDRAWFLKLRSLGGPARMVTYDNMDHRVPVDMLLSKDWRDWLFQQAR